MKKIIILILIVNISAFSQVLTLEECRKAAKENSPLAAKEKLLKSEQELKKDNLSTNYLPQINLNGRASYQSDVFDLPVQIPGAAFPEISKDQYVTQVEISQLIWDGGKTSVAKELNDISSELQVISNETEIFQLNELINSLYLNSLLLQKNKNTLEVMLESLNERRTQINSAVENGVMLKSDLNSIDIEIIKLKQQIRSMISDRKAVLKMLETHTGLNVQNAELKYPQVGSDTSNFHRPEYELFALKKKSFKKQKEMEHTNYFPKISAYVQAGYGKPNPVNFISDEFESFYKAGVQFSWNVWSWNKHEREKQISEIKIKSTSLEERNFIKNLNAALIKSREEIDKIAEMIKSDKRIIELQKQNTEVVFSKLSNGTATSTEYITERNLLKKAKLDLNTHELQLIKAKLDYLNKSGKFYRE